MEDHRGLILLDVSPGTAGEFDQAILEQLGHPVLVCHGPQEGTCPLLTDHDCGKFRRAHGVVFKLDLRRADHRAIIERYQELKRPEMPIRVLVSEGDAEKYADLLAGVQVWTHEPTVADLDGFAAQVEAADGLR
jgi:hypothetical protein